MTVKYRKALRYFIVFIIILLKTHASNIMIALQIMKFPSQIKSQVKVTFKGLAVFQFF